MATKKIPKLQIVREPVKPFREKSARGLYWERFKKFNNKPIAELEKSCSEDPPSKPKKGPLRDKQEPFGGWVSFFKQKGLIAIT